LAYPNFSKQIPYISVTDEASNFKFGTQLKFDNAHHKITPIKESKRDFGLGEIPKFRFPCNISAMA